MHKILLISGSTRKGSYNKKLLDVCANLLKLRADQINTLDLSQFPLPIYNGDLEANEGIPENAKKLSFICQETGGFIIASPEYNSSIPPLLKNTIDWISRIKNQAFRNKIVGLISASTGQWGGIRNLSHLRSIMNHVGALVIPQQFCLPEANKAFTDQGDLSNEKNLIALKTLIDNFTSILELQFNKNKN